eukprot:tig00021135_g18952.t1
MATRSLSPPTPGAGAAEVPLMLHVASSPLFDGTVPETPPAAYDDTEVNTDQGASVFQLFQSLVSSAHADGSTFSSPRLPSPMLLATPAGAPEDDVFSWFTLEDPNGSPGPALPTASQPDAVRPTAVRPPSPRQPPAAASAVPSTSCGCGKSPSRCHEKRAARVHCSLPASRGKSRPKPVVSTRHPAPH